MSGEHRCYPGAPHLPIGGTWGQVGDAPSPPREPGKPPQERDPGPGKPQQRESVTLTRPKSDGPGRA